MAVKRGSKVSPSTFEIETQGVSLLGTVSWPVLVGTRPGNHPLTPTCTPQQHRDNGATHALGHRTLPRMVTAGWSAQGLTGYLDGLDGFQLLAVLASLCTVRK